MSTYTIAFSQASTLATALSPVEAGGTLYYLKAQSTDRRSRQHVGYARVESPRKIVVTTAARRPVGVARSRAEAVALIDAYHRTHNAADYWLWASKTLLVRGKAVSA